MPADGAGEGVFEMLGQLPGHLVQWIQIFALQQKMPAETTPDFTNG